MQKYIVIHYNEIALKGGNRQFFENKLTENIRKALKGFGRINLRSIMGRLIIEVKKDWDLDLLKNKLRQVFGIEYFQVAWNSEQDLKQIEKNLLVLLKEIKFQSFRLTVRRTNKNFPLGSQELSVRLGALVNETLDKKVDLKNFDLNCHLDIVDNFAFIYFEKIRCSGGLPVGVSGKLLVLISGGIDSPVAAYLMQKRGSKIVFVNFDSYPTTPKENQEKVKDLIRILDQYQGETKLYLVPFLDIQKEILNNVPEDYRVIFYRRMMLRISRMIANKEDILALVTGDSLGQVASQTVENIQAISAAIDLPIFRPLIGFNKDETIAIAEKIRTLEISNQPFADCCSLFMPKHPVTRADLKLIDETEKDWEFMPLLAKAFKNAKIIKF